MLITDCDGTSKTRGELVNRLCVVGLAALGLALANGQTGESKRGDLWKRDAQAAAQAGQGADASAGLPAFLQLRADFPENSRVVRNLAWQEQRAGNPADAEKFLQMYAAMGATLSEASPIYKAFSDAGMLARVPELKRNTESKTTGSLAFALDDANLVAEDIAYDPATKHFFVSSVHRKKILECDAAGKCQDAIVSTAEAPLDAVQALRVDAAHGVLWATTAALNVEADFRPESKGRSAIMKFNLPSHRLIRRFDPEDKRDHGIGDMTIARNGDIYASDGQSGDVYVIRHDGSKLETLVPAGEFISPQTPALNDDESILYVPDYLEGIAAVHLKDGTIEWVKAATPTALEGIDGLYWTKDGLIATQNGVSPERIVRFRLSASNVVSGFEVLEANWAGLGEPTHGVIVGQDFYCLVNSGWDRVGQDGTLAAGKPAAVWKMKLAARK
jgi:sugar lactone lactonase YvrE